MNPPVTDPFESFRAEAEQDEAKPGAEAMLELYSRFLAIAVQQLGGSLLTTQDALDKLNGEELQCAELPDGRLLLRLVKTGTNPPVQLPGMGIVQ